MLNILVPTDFSDLSKVAIRYAIAMAKKMNGKVTLLHVVNTAQHASGARLRLRSLIDEFVKMAEKDFKPVLAEANKANKGGKPIRHAIELGPSFVDVVSRFAKKSKASLIITGTHGASGLKKVVMGSNTASLLEASNIPVLAIPATSSFKKIKLVVYATDLLNAAKEFKTLLSVVGKEKPLIHIVHVTTDKEAATVAESKLDKMVIKSKYKNVVVRVLVNENTPLAINNYIKKVKVDVLTMFPHKHSFFEKLFNRSVTKQLSFLNSAPLLAYKSK
ncbi:MAG: universal stress protein [Cyclobacteriaceae bacterium]|nr:universal stress protein [Cyclobacteriaceae bacterium]